jgi:drug/metabolite transporter (DMT)-like permease
MEYFESLAAYLFFEFHKENARYADAKGIYLRLVDWVKFIVIGLVWGSTFMWVKLGIREIGPFTLVMYRALFATLALFVVIRYKKMTPFPGKYAGIFLIMGLLNAALPFALVAMSEKYISSGMASILNSTVPFFALVIAPFFIPEEKITVLKLFGILLGLCGVVLLMSNKVTESFLDFGIGQVLMLLAAFSYAVAAIYARKKAPFLEPEWQAFLQMGSAFLILLPAAILMDGGIAIPKLPLTWLAIFWMGVMGSCVSLLIFFQLLRELGPTRTTLTSYLFPVTGVILGILFLGEQIDLRMIFAGVIILVGVILVNQKEEKVFV